MTTQSNVSNPMEVAPARSFSWPLALAILALGLILGVIAANLAPIITKSDVTQVDTQRARAAEVARYQSLGLFYAAGNAAERQQAIAAETARYSGLATQADAQRIREAESARYTGLGLFYAAGNAAERQQAMAAETARYSGLVESSGVKLPSGESRSLAWPPRPTQFYPAQNRIVALTETALAQYHQSEWGPVSQVETHLDGDIGLMEFSTK